MRDANKKAHFYRTLLSPWIKYPLTLTLLFYTPKVPLPGAAFAVALKYKRRIPPRF
jgi:hypothetical protein